MISVGFAKNFFQQIFWSSWHFCCHNTLRNSLNNKRAGISTSKKAFYYFNTGSFMFIRSRNQVSCIMKPGRNLDYPTLFIGKTVVLNHFPGMLNHATDVIQIMVSQFQLFVYKKAVVDIWMLRERLNPFWFIIILRVKFVFLKAGHQILSIKISFFVFALHLILPASQHPHLQIPLPTW